MQNKIANQKNIMRDKKGGIIRKPVGAKVGPVSV